ncbi:MAG TPA: hypothetical protein DCF89_06105 [Flavobacteriales bacterium]|nr:hypothetical protein [Crocinitomicaceae bacterium]HAE30670.1 hypothetical protein [Flavobacteriales bacterium]|tara:strand:- start:386 stop:727 length:342 start_codon:yes stop_codon:yes gene_type:complete
MENNENQPAAAEPTQAAASAPAATVKEKPPKAVIGMIFGIASIVFCYLGALSLVLGLLAVIWHGKAKKVYLTDEAKYKSGYTLAKVGNITGWIGMPLSFIYFIFWVMWVIAIS